MAKKSCLTCGASTVEYRHILNKNLVTSLAKMYGSSGPVNLKDLGLTRNQWDNFQKLRYWGLVSKSFKEDGTRIGGTWQITSRGIDFMEGRLQVQKKAITYRRDTVEFEGELVGSDSFFNVAYKQRNEYSADAISREN